MISHDKLKFSSFATKSKGACPACHKEASGVLAKTLVALLTPDTKSDLASLDGFYFCKNPTCDVIYFKENQTLTQKDLSISVGLKKGAKPANVCYCFGWTKEKIKEELLQDGKSRALEDIKHQMDTIGCSCDIKNPGGSCCLGDVSKVIKEMKETLDLSGKRG